MPKQCDNCRYKKLWGSATAEIDLSYCKLDETECKLKNPDNNCPEFKENITVRVLLSIGIIAVVIEIVIVVVLPKL